MSTATVATSTVLNFAINYLHKIKPQLNNLNPNKNLALIKGQGGESTSKITDSNRSGGVTLTESIGSGGVQDPAQNSDNLNNNLTNQPEQTQYEASNETNNTSVEK